MRPTEHSVGAAAAALVLLLAAAAGAAVAGVAGVQEPPPYGNGVQEAEEAAGEREGKADMATLGRSVLAELARQLVTNHATNSQVLSLNLTNLFILLVLKALLFGAGMFSFGLLNHKGHHHATGRSSEGEAVSAASAPYASLTESELLLALSFLAGDSGKGDSEGFGCLHRVACERPKQAKDYAAAGKLLLKGAKMFDGVLPYNPKYETVVTGLQKAAEVGITGGDCAQRFSCSKAS